MTRLSRPVGAILVATTVLLLPSSALVTAQTDDASDPAPAPADSTEPAPDPAPAVPDTLPAPQDVPEAPPSPPATDPSPDVPSAPAAPETPDGQEVGEPRAGVGQTSTGQVPTGRGTTKIRTSATQVGSSVQGYVRPGKIARPQTFARP